MGKNYSLYSGIGLLQRWHIWRSGPLSVATVALEHRKIQGYTQTSTQRPADRAGDH